MLDALVSVRMHRKCGSACSAPDTALTSKCMIMEWLVRVYGMLMLRPRYCGARITTMPAQHCIDGMSIGCLGAAKAQGAYCTSGQQLHHNAVCICFCPRGALQNTGKGLSPISNNIPVCEGRCQ